LHPISRLCRKSFKGKDTRKLFETGKSASFGSILKVPTRKLSQLEAAATLEFLRSPPDNRVPTSVSSRPPWASRPLGLHHVIVP
jgi:plasmid maintenance system killer protein